MSTDVENINTVSIEEMINANLGIDATKLEENSSEEPTDILEQAEALHEEIEEPLEMPKVDNLVSKSEETTSNSDLTNDDIDLSSHDLEENTSQPVEEAVTAMDNVTEKIIGSDFSATDAEIETLEEPEINVENNDLEAEVANEKTTDTTKDKQAEAVPGAEPMLALETEVSELENEIQDQLDQFVVQAGHLKSNIKSELQRVSSDNEKLQEQVSSLAQQLSDAEEKIQGFTEVQDKQQATIHKLILIIKGIRTKISHLYDQE